LSSNACWISALVFITKEIYYNTGSPIGLPFNLSIFASVAPFINFKGWSDLADME
jgi:hypothetical protein